MDVVIVDLTCIHFMQKKIYDDKHVTMMAIQEKTSYIEQTSGDDFIPLVIETYGCFHSRFYLFFSLVH